MQMIRRGREVGPLCDESERRKDPREMSLQASWLNSDFKYAPQTREFLSPFPYTAGALKRSYAKQAIARTPYGARAMSLSCSSTPLSECGGEVFGCLLSIIAQPTFSTGCMLSCMLWSVYRTCIGPVCRNLSLEFRCDRVCLTVCAEPCVLSVSVSRLPRSPGVF